MSELLDTKSKLLSQLESKVELKEVQSALNECQNEICEQLSEFKKTAKNDVHQIEGDLYKILDRKANLLDVQEALNHKADLRDVANLPQKSDLQEMQYKLERIGEEVSAKLDQRGTVIQDNIFRLR